MKKLTISVLAAIAIACLALVQLASVSRPGKVTFVFKNIGHVLHDFSIRGRKTPLIQPGKTAKLVVSFTKKGKYAYLCTVPGHAQAGMKGTFTVR